MQENSTNWYPPPGHPREDTDRIIFDNLYSLRDQKNNAAANNAAPSSDGATGTAYFATGFTVGGNNGPTYHNMTFSKGLFKGFS